LLTDSKLTLESSSWFIPVKNGYPQIEAKHIRFELHKTPESERTDEQKRVFEEIKNEWSSVVEDVRTRIMSYSGHLFIPDYRNVA